MDKLYKIKVVQPRKEWGNSYGQFQDYALQLEGLEGWVSKSQKLETQPPIVGQEIFGHIEVQTQGDHTFQKFKGARNPNPSQASTGGATQKDVAYIIMMLEELTGRRTSPDSPTTREDVLPTDEDMEKPFDLSEIPF